MNATFANKERRLLYLAAFSRIATIALQFISNHLIADHKADAFVSPEPPLASTKPADWLIELVLGGFRRWDAQYFLHIAEHGNTHDNVLAFYPLYPLIVRYTAMGLAPLAPTLLSMRSATLLVAVALNVLFFIMAAQMLYRLTQRMFPKKVIAEVATVLFCINPASIFFTAPYSESLFALLSFTVMLYSKELFLNNTKRIGFFDVQKKNVLFMVLVGCIFCRSNGMINVGFVIFHALNLGMNNPRQSNLMFLCRRLSACMGAIVCAFFVHQLFNFYSICQPNIVPSHIQEFIEQNNLISASCQKPADHWCFHSFPLSYFYIQSHYWNVGFLKYYQLKQLPNIFLATPVVFLFIKHLSIEAIPFPRHINKFLKDALTTKNMRTGHRIEMLPFYLHATFLTVFCVCFVHTQVTTRLLASSTPCFFWFAAKSAGIFDLSAKVDGVALFWKQRNWIKIWFLSYFVIGTVLFSNFLPWT